MSTHRWCCCGANPPSECAHECDFATSYLMTGLTGSVNWNRVKRGALCGPCFNYEGPSIKKSDGVVISINQVYNQTLQRVATEGGGCCYRVSGTLRFSWSFVISYEYGCCPDGQICSYTVGDNGTTDVSFCLTAVCGANLWNGGDAWTWTLTTCGFACGDYELLDFGATDCEFGYDCGEPPLRTSRILIGPSKYTWKSKMISPGSLVTTTDVVGLGFCDIARGCGNAVPGTDPTSANENCMPNQALLNDLNGPFALGYGLTSDPLPDECLDSYGAADAIRLDPPYGIPFPGWCTGQIDASGDCIDLTMNDYFNFPDFT